MVKLVSETPNHIVRQQEDERRRKRSKDAYDHSLRELAAQIMRLAGGAGDARRFQNSLKAFADSHAQAEREGYQPYTHDLADALQVNHGNGIHSDYFREASRAAFRLRACELQGLDGFASKQRDELLGAAQRQQDGWRQRQLEREAKRRATVVGALPDGQDRLEFETLSEPMKDAIGWISGKLIPWTDPLDRTLKALVKRKIIKPTSDGRYELTAKGKRFDKAR